MNGLSLHMVFREEFTLVIKNQVSATNAYFRSLLMPSIQVLKPPFT